MRVNFNVQLKDFDGQPMVDEKGNPLVIRNLVGKSLFVGNGIKKTGNADIDEDNRFKAYLLSQRVMASTGEIDLSPEELVLIKQSASTFQGAGVYAQIRELVDKKEDN